jgi:hypothetical protein
MKGLRFPDPGRKFLRHRGAGFAVLRVVGEDLGMEGPVLVELRGKFDKVSHEVVMFVTEELCVNGIQFFDLYLAHYWRDVAATAAGKVEDTSWRSDPRGQESSWVSLLDGVYL